MITRLRQVLLLAFTIAALLATSSRLPADTGTCGGGMTTLPFTDVAGNAFFCQIAEAFYSGLTNGTTPSTYSPTDYVTREQMAAFITRTQDSTLRRGSRRAAIEQWATPSGVQGSISVSDVPELIRSDGRGSLWITTQGGLVQRYTPGSAGFISQNEFPNAFGLLVWRNEVFVTTRTSPGWLWRHRNDSNLWSVIELPNEPIGITTDGTYIWTANYGSGSVSRVGGLPNSGFGPVYTISTGFAQPVGALFDGTNVWITDFADSRLKKLDSNGAILQSVPAGTGPESPVFDGSNIWVPSYFSDSLTVVRAKDGVVLANLTGNGLSRPLQAVFDGERILVTNFLGNSVSLWKASDLTPIRSISLNATPFGACSDGVNFWVVLQGGVVGSSVVAF